MVDKSLLLSFAFSGGDADDKLLNFYDAGRFQYGAARMLYTIEHFRRTGKVLSKITKRVSIDLRAPSAHNNSWIQDVILMGGILGPHISEAMIKVPLDVMVAWTVGKLTPKKESMEIAGKMVSSVADASKTHAIAEAKQSDNASAMISLMDKMYTDSQKLHQDQLRQAGEQIRSLTKELKSAEQRERALIPYHDALGIIDAESEKKLLDRIAPLLSEVARPVERSADSLYISSENIGDKIVYIDRFTLQRLNGDVVDPLPTLMQGDIKRYDKETGWGRFKNFEFPKGISFVVPSAKKNSVNWDVIDAMKSASVEAIFYMVKSKRNVIQHLIFDDVAMVPE